MIYPDNSSYEGQWKDDKKHGKGDYKWEDGSVLSGTWKEGKQELGTLEEFNEAG